MNQLKSENRLRKNFLAFIKHLFIRQISNFVIILGRRGSGKTDFALLVAETLYQLGIIKHVGTNIKIYESRFPIAEVTNLLDLRHWAINEKGQKLFIFDEVGKAFRRRTPMSSLNIHIIDQFQILRKYKLSIIAITVNEKFIDSGVLGSDMLDGYFEKVNFKNPKIGIYHDNLENFYKELYDIPRTTVKFDTWDSAPFQEFPKESVRFKEEDKQALWKWCNGATADSIGLKRTQIRRIAHKYIKANLEKELQSNV